MPPPSRFDGIACRGAGPRENVDGGCSEGGDIDANLYYDRSPHWEEYNISGA
jgi:hypothetical protein